jgi:hypothetical protein
MTGPRTPIILDVNPDPDAVDWDEDFLDRLDLPVVHCYGPQAGQCPLLVGLPCGKIDHADGILFQLDLDILDHRRILERYADTLDVPIRAVATKEQQERYADLLHRVEVFTPPVGPATLDAFAAEVGSETD